MRRPCCCCTASRRRMRCGTASPAPRAALPPRAARPARLRRFRQAARRAGARQLQQACNGRRHGRADASLGTSVMRQCGHDRARALRTGSARPPPAGDEARCSTSRRRWTCIRHTDMRFASAYYHHWFHLIQPSPLPETMIGGQPALLPALEARRLGSSGVGHIEPVALAEYERCFCRAETIHAVCEDYRAAAGIDLEHDRASRAAGQKIAWRHAGAVGERGVGAGDVRAAGAVAGSVQRHGRAAREAGHFPRRGAAEENRGGSTSSPDTPTTPTRKAPCSSGCKRLDQHFPVRFSAWLPAPWVRCSRLLWVAFDRGGTLALVFLALTLVGVRATRARRAMRCCATTGDRPSALPARVHPARDAAVLIEGDNEAALFSRQQRSLVHQRQGRPDSGRSARRWTCTRSATSGSTTAAARVHADARLPRHHRRGPAQAPTTRACSTSRR